jgi:hypothetical protein
MAEHSATQVAHPWRAVVRTAFQITVAVAAGMPLLYTAATGGDPAAATGAFAVILGVAAAVTRVMALPWVDQFIRRWLPWLAPSSSE